MKEREKEGRGTGRDPTERGLQTDRNSQTQTDREKERDRETDI